MPDPYSEGRYGRGGRGGGSYRRGVHLRVSAAKNNQAHGVRWARDYEFEVSLRRYASAEAPHEHGTEVPALRAVE